MLHFQPDMDIQMAMSLQFLCLSLCVYTLLGSSLSDNEGQRDTTQTLSKLGEGNVAIHLRVLEAKFETLEKENALLKSELASLKSEITGRNFGDGNQGDEGDGYDAKTITSRPSPMSGDKGNYRVSASTDKASPRVANSLGHVNSILENQRCYYQERERSLSENRNRHVYRIDAQQVAFQAVLDHSIGNLGDDETIKFTRVDLNLGNDYNANTGMFTCSVSGLYVFHINIVSHPAKSVELHFLKNGGTFGIVYLGDDGVSLSMSASSTAIVQLAVSDTVWIATNTNHNAGDVLLPGYCYFSGYLLSPVIV